MAISKETASLGMPYEKSYGYAQAVKVGDTVYVSGQVGHDEQGNPAVSGNMEMQMRQAYVNIGRVLAQLGATMENIVEETIFVTDMDAALAAVPEARKKSFPGDSPVVASAIVQIQRLALPELMVEIRCIARV
ncbi:MAG: Rid family hydrolase [Acidobacteriota bacterium]